MNTTQSRREIYAGYIVLLLLIQASTALAQLQKPKVVPELWQEVRDYGTVRVIAQLNVTWRPEEKLVLGERVLQRRAIANAQQQIVMELAGTRHRVISLPQDRPFLVLNVEQEALAVLDRSTLVSSVTRDPKQPAAR